ncbi:MULTISPECIES: hypothetical protein [Francisella]|jgi:hypothetical protein|uniref:Uncharacterized protein n=3 Tax=Francisella TaxID=262 RepID=A0AAJ4TKP3_9GAMM|nr:MULTISPECIES: hypothetical protein [Francisella]AEI35629.1 hypothetical protein F7308_0702 [Francisella salina]QEO57533.1 hypothetical protein F0R74_06590 [Francisella marina]QEO58348.1 hypothetical protein F0R75_00630 [Francisella marina]QWU99028.1 hypothetical protein KQR59_07970 [Francisella salimarina]
MTKIIEDVAEFAHKNHISEETVKELIAHFTNDVEKIQKFILEKTECIFDANIRNLEIKEALKNLK